eukprot:GEZU01017905.1.p1 GENE.GEZU01017905.1~~GEZU01017905.1.p1  ORF type:complete len:389 (-),score=89.98 GEZU01017905.1:139-1305(-)
MRNIEETVSSLSSMSNTNHNRLRRQHWKKRSVNGGLFDDDDDAREFESYDGGENEDEEELLFEQIAADLQTLNKNISTISRIITELGTPHDTASLRRELRKANNDAFALSRSIHNDLLTNKTNDSRLTSSFSGTWDSNDKNTIYRRKLTADYRKLLAQLKEVSNTVKQLEKRYPQPPPEQDHDHDHDHDHNHDEHGNESHLAATATADAGADADEKLSKILSNATNEPKLQVIYHEDMEGNNDKGTDEQQRMLMAQRSAGMTTMMTYEERELEQIYSEVEELAQVFKDINEMTIQQGECLDDLQKNVEYANKDTKRAVKELSTAARYATMGMALMGATVGGVLGGPIGFVAGAKTALALGGCVVVGVAVGSVGAGAVGKIMHKINKPQ